MENIKVISKSIEKAVEDGYNLADLGFEEGNTWQIVQRLGLPDFLFEIMDGTKVEWKYDVEKIILTPNFAKAFFGTSKMNTGKFLGEDFSVMLVNGKHATLTPEIVNEWEYHLQQMVVSEDPVQYLSKFI
jgi:hypothetical protein